MAVLLNTICGPLSPDRGEDSMRPAQYLPTARCHLSQLESRQFLLRPSKANKQLFTISAQWSCEWAADWVETIEEGSKHNSTVKERRNNVHSGCFLNLSNKKRTACWDFHLVCSMIAGLAIHKKNIGEVYFSGGKTA